MYDFIRQLRVHVYMVSNDAKLFYDRIINGGTGLALQRSVLPMEHIKSTFTTIQQLSRYVQVIYGGLDLIFIFLMVVHPSKEEDKVGY